MTPLPVDDPAAVLAPLEPGERVIWKGRPSGLPNWRFWRNLVPSSLLLAASSALVAATTGAARMALGALLGLAVLVLVGRFAQFWSVRSSRRYVATNRRAAIVDTREGWIFPLEAKALRCERRAVVLKDPAPKRTAASFDELADPEAALREIRAALDAAA